MVVSIVHDLLGGWAGMDRAERCTERKRREINRFRGAVVELCIV